MKQGRTIKYYLSILGMSLIAVVSVIFLLATPALFLKADNSNPCYLTSEEIELEDYIAKGLNNENLDTYKSRGTITKIQNNPDNSRSFFVERMSLTSRTTRGLYISNTDYVGDLTVGDIVSFNGTFVSNNDEYYLKETNYLNVCGKNPYGDVVAKEISSNTSFSASQNGCYFYLPKAHLKSSFKVTNFSNLEVTAYHLSDGSNDFSFSLLIDTRDESINSKIINELSSFKIGDYLKAYGNYLKINNDDFLVISTYLDVSFNRTNPTRTVDLFAINDFHGEVSKASKITTYFKSLKTENSLFLNSGDMWQGSLESNTNRGKLLTQVMNEIGFDTFTLGNHEFDWGIDEIINNKQYTSTRFLGANIYHWDKEKKTFLDFANELVDEYYIKDLPNGLRVGVIGVIGDKQITSISSNMVQDIGFKAPIPIISDLSSYLRTKKACDVVVVSAHGGQAEYLNSSVSLNVDAVFCAHTHQAEKTIENGVAFIQGGSYGNNVSKISLSVTGTSVTTSYYGNLRFYASNYTADPVVENLVNESNKQISDLLTENLGTLSGDLEYQTNLPRMVAHAISEEALSQGYKIDLSFCNKARTGLSQNVTYKNLFKAIPFDNQIFIAKVKGKDLIRQANYSGFYRVSSTKFESSKTYTIAVLDYLLFHQNTSRIYDYFGSGFEVIATLEKVGYEKYNYRQITADFLRKQTSPIDVSLYTSLNNRNNKSLLGSNVSF